MNPETHIPLSRLSPELDGLQGATARSPGYRKLHMMVLDGHLQTEVVNGRHYVAKAALPDIARMLGMMATKAKAGNSSRAGLAHAAA